MMRLEINDINDSNDITPKTNLCQVEKENIADPSTNSRKQSEQGSTVSA